TFAAPQPGGPFREERFLFELDELLRASSDSSRLLTEISARLGAYLSSECVFDHIYLSTLSDEELWGRTVVADDTSDDAPPSSDEEPKSPPKARARIVVPLGKGDRRVFALVVSSAKPRRWHAREVALARSVAERTWPWFEYLKAQEAQRRDEE